MTRPFAETNYLQHDPYGALAIGREHPPKLARRASKTVRIVLTLRPLLPTLLVRLIVGLASGVDRRGHPLGSRAKRLL